MVRLIATTAILLALAAPARADWNTASHVPLTRLYAAGPITLTFTGCPTRPTRACTISDDLPVRIYIPPRQYQHQSLAGVYYHELGHAFDALLLTDPQRAALKRAMGAAPRPWRSPPNSPHEQFAEAFRLCATYGPRWTMRGDYTIKYGWQPTRRRYATTCRLIRRLAS